MCLLTAACPGSVCWCPVSSATVPAPTVVGDDVCEVISPYALQLTHCDLEAYVPVIRNIVTGSGRRCWSALDCFAMRRVQWCCLKCRRTCLMKIGLAFNKPAPSCYGNPQPFLPHLLVFGVVYQIDQPQKPTAGKSFLRGQKRGYPWTATDQHDCLLARVGRERHGDRRLHFGRARQNRVR